MARRGGDVTGIREPDRPAPGLAGRSPPRGAPGGGPRPRSRLDPPPRRGPLRCLRCPPPSSALKNRTCFAHAGARSPARHRRRGRRSRELDLPKVAAEVPPGAAAARPPAPTTAPRCGSRRAPGRPATGGPELRACLERPPRPHQRLAGQRQVTAREAVVGDDPDLPAAPLRLADRRPVGRRLAASGLAPEPAAPAPRDQVAEWSGPRRPDRRRARADAPVQRSARPSLVPTGLALAVKRHINGTTRAPRSRDHPRS